MPKIKKSEGQFEEHSCLVWLDHGRPTGDVHKCAKEKLEGERAGLLLRETVFSR